MRPTKITWATCPECGVEINGFTYYSAHLLMGSLNWLLPMACPKCTKPFFVSCDVELTFRARKQDGAGGGK